LASGQLQPLLEWIQLLGVAQETLE